MSRLQKFQVLNGTYVVLTALTVMIVGQLLTEELTTWTTVVGAAIWLFSIPFIDETEGY